jgi:hypothetical protein
MLSSSAIFLVACTIGVAYQTVSMSRLYFAYKTTTSLEIGIPAKIAPTATSVCTNYLDVLDYERLNNLTGRSWSSSPTYDESLKYQDDLSISEIFKYTPKEDNVMAELWHRVADSYEISALKGKQCYDHFNVTKYLYLQQVCYRFSPVEKETVPYSFFAVTPSIPGLIYNIILRNSTLRKSLMIRVISHRPNMYPYRSLKSSAVIVRKVTTGGQRTEYNLFITNQVSLKRLLQPSPYDNDCFDYMSIGYESDEHCSQACVHDKVLHEFKKVPFSVLIKEPSNQQIVSYNDVKDRSFSHRVLEIERECREKICRQDHCDIRLSIAETVASPDSDLTVCLVVPSHPSFVTTTHPKMNLVEFLTYIMSTLGIWSGLSIMTFEPRNMCRMVRRRIRHITHHSQERKQMRERHDLISHKLLPPQSQGSSVFNLSSH